MKCQICKKEIKVHKIWVLDFDDKVIYLKVCSDCRKEIKKIEEN